jgi:hypothetical protein
VIGVAMGRVVSGRRADVPRPLLAAALLGVVVSLAVPLPRTTVPVSAVMRTSPAGPAAPAVNRDGLPSPYQPVNVDLTLTPPDAAQGVDRFNVLSWQGGGERTTDLVEVRPGEYRTASPVPTGASWKTLIWLVRRDVLMALPVSMPLDVEAGQGPIVPAPVKTVHFVIASSLLMRETHSGALWPQLLAYSGLGLVTLLWVGVLLVGFASLDRSYAGGAASRRLQTGKAGTRPLRVPAVARR